jgi:L-ascorbate metabolism protein UlaG (beta-lactamase superfamily)
MQIKYYGHSCFVLVSKDGTSVLTDPYTKVGYELPAGLTADIVTTSHSHFDHNYINAISYKKLIDKSGAQAENIFGIECYHDPKQGSLRGKNIIYKITLDGIVFCHLGDIGEEISSQLIEKIGQVDVLFVPIGGTYTIDARQAKEYVDRINPKTVIPMHYKPSDGTLDIASAGEFLSFFPETEIEYIPNGKTDYALNSERKRILYMERIG